MHITSVHRGARARVVHALAWQHDEGMQSRSVVHSAGACAFSLRGATTAPVGPTAGGISLPRPCGGEVWSVDPDCTEAGDGGHALGDIGPGSA